MGWARAIAEAKKATVAKLMFRMVLEIDMVDLPSNGRDSTRTTLLSVNKVPEHKHSDAQSPGSVHLHCYKDLIIVFFAALYVVLRP